MTSKPSFWQRIGIQDWFIPTDGSTPVAAKPLTPNDVYKYIIKQFEESVAELSFSERSVFYHEYIICLNGDDYKEFSDHKKGLLGLIAQESVKNFYILLKGHAAAGKTVEPSSNKWVFRFVSHPDYRPGDIGFIGKLLPDSSPKEENLRVTFIPRQTGLAQTFDVNNDILQDFIYYSEGYYEIPFTDSFKPAAAVEQPVSRAVLARLETTVPDRAFAGQKLEYLIRTNETIVSGNEESSQADNIFKIPSEWVNAPHLKIRFDQGEEQFYLASFGEKTILNEVLVAQSDIDAPEWTALPLNSRIILNGIIGINIFKS